MMSAPFPCNYRRSPHCTGYTTSGYGIPWVYRDTGGLTVTGFNAICRPCLEHMISTDMAENHAENH